MGIADEETLQITARVAAFFSIAGSTGVIFLYLRAKGWSESTHHTILFWMSCSDFMYSIMMLIGSGAFSSAIGCDLQGFFIHSAAFATQIWCTVVGANLLFQMKFFWTEAKCKLFMHKWHLMAWGSSLALTALPVIISGFTPLTVWCWIPGSYPELRMGTFYVPLWMLFAVNAVIVWMIIKQLKEALKTLPDSEDFDATRGHYKWVVRQTLLFVFAGMLVWLPGTINRVWEWFSEDGKSSDVTTFLQVLFTPLQGLFNFLVYYLPKLMCNPSFTCCGKNEEDEKPGLPLERTELSRAFSVESSCNSEHQVRGLVASPKDASLRIVPVRVETHRRPRSSLLPVVHHASTKSYTFFDPATLAQIRASATPNASKMTSLSKLYVSNVEAPARYSTGSTNPSVKSPTGSANPSAKSSIRVSRRTPVVRHVTGPDLRQLASKRGPDEGPDDDEGPAQILVMDENGTGKLATIWSENHPQDRGHEK